MSLLDLHNTGTGFRIVPVPSLYDPSFTPAPDPNEVADVFEVPLAFLMQEQNHVRHLREWKDRRILFYAMEYEQRLEIWVRRRRSCATFMNGSMRMKQSREGGTR